MAERRHHRADLVVTTGVQADQQVVLAVTLGRRRGREQIHRCGISPASHDLRDPADALQIRMLRADSRRRIAVHADEVGLANATLPKCFAVEGGRAAIAGHEDEPLRDPIEPMAEPKLAAEGTLHRGDPGMLLRIAGQFARDARRLPEHELARGLEGDLGRHVGDVRRGSMRSAIGESGAGSSPAATKRSSRYSQPGGSMPSRDRTSSRCTISQV